MKYCFVLFLLIITVVSPLLGQDIPMPGESTTPKNSSNPEIGGYVENTLSLYGAGERSEESVINETRARIGAEAKLNNRIDVGITLIGSLYTGETVVDASLYVPESKRAAIALPELYSYEYEDELYLQEAYTTYYGDSIYVRAGRQKFYTGTGYAYNPSDFFNTKNPVDPEYESEGIDGIRADVELPLYLNLTLLGRPGETIDESDGLIYLKGRASMGDWGLLYVRYNKSMIDFRSLNGVDYAEVLSSGDSSLLDPDNYVRKSHWNYFGGDFDIQPEGFHIYGEGGYVICQANGSEGELKILNKDHERFLLGLDYTFDFQLYLIVEYLRYGLGADSYGDLDYADYLSYNSGERVALSKNTLFTGGSYPLTDLSEFGCYLISSIDENSYTVNPKLDYNIADNGVLQCAAYCTLGRSEIADAYGWGGDVRVRGSF